MDWDHPGPPPRPYQVAAFEGEPWVFYAGSLDVLGVPHHVHRHRSLRAAREYLMEGGREFRLEDASPPIALFRALQFGKSAARTPWSALTERTKQGYRGRLRRLGIRSDADMARFHASADSATLKWLRRHGPKPADLIIVGQAPMYPASGSGSWATVWGET